MADWIGAVIWLGGGTSLFVAPYLTPFFVVAMVAFRDNIDDIDSDPADGFCNEERFLQDPDC